MKITALAGLFVAILALLAACGGGDDNTDDPRVGEIGGVAELATYAYASAGPEGLYDYVAKTVKDKCSVEEFSADLKGAEEPTSFRGMKGVKFDGDTATATVVQIFEDMDKDVKWAFVDEGDGAWRIVDAPGLSDCKP
jgi:hypothetical protein